MDTLGRDLGQWTCFHCGDTFVDVQSAKAHFGSDETHEPACRLAGQEGGLVEIIRQQEAELRQFRSEDTSTSREFYALGAEHFRKEQRAEEEGYARGLRDAVSAAFDNTSLHESIAAVSADLHTHKLYGEFYDAVGHKLNGFPGVYTLCIAMAQVMADWEQASGAGAAIYDTLEQGSWIEVVEEYVTAMLRGMIEAGDRIDAKACFKNLGIFSDAGVNP